MKKMMDVMKTILYTLVDTKTVADEINKKISMSHQDCKEDQHKVS